MPRRTSALVGVVLSAVLLGTVWLTSDLREAISAHHAAHSRWQDKEPAAYTFDYQFCSGMCAGCTVHVSVEDAKVTDAVGRGQCSTSAIDDAPTIDDVFDMEARDRRHRSVRRPLRPDVGLPGVRQHHVLRGHLRLRDGLQRHRLPPPPALRTLRRLRW